MAEVQAIHELVVIIPRCHHRIAGEGVGIRAFKIDQPAAFLIEKLMMPWIVERVVRVAGDLHRLDPWTGGCRGLGIPDLTEFGHTASGLIADHDPGFAVRVPVHAGSMDLHRLARRGILELHERAADRQALVGNRFSLARLSGGWRAFLPEIFLRRVRPGQRLIGLGIQDIIVSGGNARHGKAAGKIKVIAPLILHPQRIAIRVLPAGLIPQHPQHREVPQSLLILGDAMLHPGPQILETAIVTHQMFPALSIRHHQQAKDPHRSRSLQRQHLADPVIWFREVG